MLMWTHVASDENSASTSILSTSRIVENCQISIKKIINENYSDLISIYGKLVFINES